VFDEERFVDRGREDPGVRYALGTRGDPDLRGRVALALGHDRRAAGGTARDRAERVAGARTGMDEEGIRLPASVVRWERILRGIADEHGVWVAFASLVGFEGGKGFPGARCLEPDG